MKFDDLLAQYLYEQKHLHLQAIGTFTLDGKVSMPYDQEKGIYYPIEGLNFQHNTKEGLDDALVAFLVKKLGKIQPLVRSDLESYLSNIRQFINLGKPYTIEGVGTLHINNAGTYEFTPGNFLPVKEELNPKRENPEHNYPQKSSSSAGKVVLAILIVVASLAALGGMGWGVYTFVTKNQSAKQDTPPIDSINSEQPTVDTSNSTTADPAPANTSTAVANNGDTATFKMIFELTPSKARATTRSAQLQTLKINATYDSITSGSGRTYRIFVSKRIAQQDTSRVRDSIARFFLKKVIIEKQ